MANLLLSIIALLVFLGFITGVVVFFRWLAGVFSSSKRPSSAPGSLEDCPRCRKPIYSNLSHCSGCGLSLYGPTARELADLEATARQLARFQERRLSEAGTLADLKNQIKARLQELRGAEFEKPTPKLTPKPERKPAPTPARPTAPPSPAVPVLEAATVEDPQWVLSNEAPSVPSLPPQPQPQEAPTPFLDPRNRIVEPILTPTPASRRSFTELLAAFMEQRNILWGELVGGLLIVGCSIALVISLWHKLEENPVYQFGIFMGVTAGLFGAGMYSLKHWKLESTSRGLLVIANLLVPLNLLAITNAQFQGVGGPVLVVAELTALALFSWLVSLAGKILVPENRWLFAGSLLAISSGQLLVPRILASPEVQNGWLLGLLAAFPVACHGLGFAGILYRTNRRGPLPATQSPPLFFHLGITTFALAVCLGLLSFWTMTQGRTLGAVLGIMSPVIAFAGIPLVLGGLHIHRHLLEEEKTGTIRAAATGTALLGMLIMVTACWFAWPQPPMVLVVCGVTFLALTFAAFRYDLPVANGAALLSLVFGTFALLQLQFGTLEAGQLGLDQFLSPETGKGLIGLFIALAAASELLYRFGFVPHAIWYLFGGGFVALVSLIGVGFPTRGLGAIADPATATMVYGFYGLSGLILNLRWRRPLLSSSALALLVAATLLALWGVYPQQVPLWGAVLAGEAFLMVILAILLGHPWQRESKPFNSLHQYQSPIAVFGEPLARTGEGIAVVAILAALWSGISSQTWAFEHVVTGGCLFCLFILLGLVEQRVLPARLAGLMMMATIVAGTGWETSSYGVSIFATWSALGLAASSSLMAGIAVWTVWPKNAFEKRSPLKGGPWSLAIVKNVWLETGTLAGIISIGLMGYSLNSDPWALHTYSCLFLTATAIFLAWGFNNIWLTYVGAIFALGSATYGLSQNTQLVSPSPLFAISLLIHATFFIASSLLIQWKTRTIDNGVPDYNKRLHRLIIEPFHHAGLLTSFMALPVLLAFSQSPHWIPAGCLFWLAALWLVVAWHRLNPILFAGFQTILTLAALFSTWSWLESQEWFRMGGAASRLWDPRSLQTSGLSLGFLSLVWVVARIVLRFHARFNSLLEKSQPGVDRLVFALVILGHLILSVLAILPVLMNEWSGYGLAEWLSPWWPEFQRYYFGLGAWTLVALLSLVLIVNLWDWFAPQAILGLVILAFTVPILGSGTLGNELSPSVVLRWGFAICFLVNSGLVWFRNSLARLAIFLKCRLDSASTLPQLVRGLLLVGAAIPVLLLTLSNFYIQWGQNAPPDSSLLTQWDWNCAGSIPLVLMAVGLVGHAFREGMPGYAFAGGIIVNLATSLIVAHAHPNPQGEFWVYLAQANLIVGSLFTLVWLAFRNRLYSSSALQFRDVPFLQFQVAAIVVGNVIGWVTPVFALIQDPVQPFPVPFLEIGTPWGWLSLFLGSLTTGWLVWMLWPTQIIHVFGGLALAAGGLAACSIGKPGADNWPAFHLLSAAWTLAGLAALVLGKSFLPLLNRTLVFRHRDEVGLKTAPILFLWIRGFGLLVVLLAIRSAQCLDPFQPYGNATSAGLACLILGALAFWSRSAIDVYLSGILVNVIGGLIWVASKDTISSFLASQIICYAAASGFWFLLELSLKRRIPGGVVEGKQQLAFSHVAATLAVVFLGALVGWAILTSLNSEPPWAFDSLSWFAWGTTAFTLFLALGDPKAKHSLAGIYFVGLLGIGLVLHGMNLSPRDLVWTAALTVASYVFLTALIGWLGSRLSSLVPVHHFSRRAWPQLWFLPVEVFLALAVVFLSLWMVHDFGDLWRRLAGPLTVAFLLGSGILLADQASGLAGNLRLGTLALGVLLLVETGWSFLEATGRDPSWLWLHRNVILLVSLALMTFFYGVVLSRSSLLNTAWKESCRRTGPNLGVLASALVVVILVQEAFLYDGYGTLKAILAGTPHALINPMGVPMKPWAIAIVSLALVGLMAAGLIFAITPGKDPLGLTERGRTLYVYGAELLLVLMALHFRLTWPGLFRLGFFVQYWPFILMAIAFLGAALSELFARWEIRVLAEPLERTGIFLPMLPVLAFWVLPEEKYALLWLTAGLFYGFLFVTKRSFIFAIIAALAANMSLWVFLHYREIYFYQHPQLWLIPISLIALISEHLNRDRLTPYQQSAIRYLAMMSIYLSSTADMFIAGLGQSLIFPLVLAFLSVLGVLAGMLLRVRAFLFLGVIFLVFVLLTMIWHAGINQHRTWILWSSGIGLGVAILTLFGIFEKRRNDILHLVEELKRWN